MGYEKNLKKVTGKKKKKIILFALSTCIWCMKTKELLNSLGVEYEYIDVDLLTKTDQEEISKEFEKMKTNQSFPKILIDKTLINGFDEESIKKVLK